MADMAGISASSTHGGANFATAPNLHMGKVRAMFSSPHAFVSMCSIIREDESL